MIPAGDGPGQILLGLRIAASVSAPPSMTQIVVGLPPPGGPVLLTQSTSYTDELQRLSPAPAGQRWVGYLSNVTNYATRGQVHQIGVEGEFPLPQAASGSPFPGPFTWRAVVGFRGVSDPAFPATRPVACGTGLTTLQDEDPAPMGDMLYICADDPSAAVIGTTNSLNTRELGILPAGAVASADPGGLAALTFTLRYAGDASPAADFALSASTNLPGGSAVPACTRLLPTTNSTNRVAVAIGVPAGAKAGTYDVTLTARLPNGQTRTGTGRLTVAGGAGAGGGGQAGAGGGAAGAGGGGTGGSQGPATVARLRLAAVLPRGLSVRVARTKGIVLLLGSNRGRIATVRLFQAPGRKPKATKTVRLRVPGPVRVVLRSAKLRRGPYRVTITVQKQTFTRRGTLTR